MCTLQLIFAKFNIQIYITIQKLNSIFKFNFLCSRGESAALDHFSVSTFFGHVDDK